MIGNENPIVFLRRLVHTVKGIEKAQEWRMYFSVAFLCIAAAMLLVVQAATLTGPPVEKAVNGQQHVMLRAEKISVQPMPPSPVEEPARPKGKPAEERPVQKESVQKKEDVGEWYYSVVHKDWRFRKK